MVRTEESAFIQYYQLCNKESFIKIKTDSPIYARIVLHNFRLGTLCIYYVLTVVEISIAVLTLNMLMTPMG